MLLFAAHVDSDLMYAGSFAAGFEAVGPGMPMNFVPNPFRHDWNDPRDAKNFVCGSCDASGIVSPVAPLPPAAALAAAAASAEPGLIALPLTTFHPGGS